MTIEKNKRVKECHYFYQRLDTIIFFFAIQSIKIIYLFWHSIVIFFSKPQLVWVFCLILELNSYAADRIHKTDCGHKTRGRDNNVEYNARQIPCSLKFNYELGRKTNVKKEQNIKKPDEKKHRCFDLNVGHIRKMRFNERTRR